jgi:hypothetical protein
VGIGGRDADGQRDAVAIHHQVELGARFAPVNRVRPGLLTPLLARTLKLSRLARLQSMAASSPNQFSTVWCNRCQTSASCQSRNRRQQVVPLPQSSSFGNKRHGHPVRRTKMIPPRAVRSGTRGRPRFGLGCSWGSRGSMASQRSSGTKDVAFMAGHHATSVLQHALSMFAPGQCTRQGVMAPMFFRGSMCWCLGPRTIPAVSSARAAMTHLTHQPWHPGILPVPDPGEGLPAQI